MTAGGWLPPAASHGTSQVRTGWAVLRSVGAPGRAGAVSGAELAAGCVAQSSAMGALGLGRWLGAGLAALGAVGFVVMAGGRGGLARATPAGGVAGRGPPVVAGATVVAGGLCRADAQSAAGGAPTGGGLGLGRCGESLRLAPEVQVEQAREGSYQVSLAGTLPWRCLATIPFACGCWCCS